MALISPNLNRAEHSNIPALVFCPILHGWPPSVPWVQSHQQAPAEGIDDGQITQSPSEPNQQDHCAQGVVCVVWNINCGEWDLGSLSPNCLYRERKGKVSLSLKMKN